MSSYTIYPWEDADGDSYRLIQNEEGAGLMLHVWDDADGTYRWEVTKVDPSRIDSNSNRGSGRATSRVRAKREAMQRAQSLFIERGIAWPGDDMLAPEERRWHAEVRAQRLAQRQREHERDVRVRGHRRSY